MSRKKATPKYVVIYRSASRKEWEKEGWKVTAPTTQEGAQSKKQFLEHSGRFCLSPRKQSEVLSIGVPDTFSSDDPLPGSYFDEPQDPHLEGDVARLNLTIPEESNHASR